MKSIIVLGLALVLCGVMLGGSTTNNQPATAGVPQPANGAGVSDGLEPKVFLIGFDAKETVISYTTNLTVARAIAAGGGYTEFGGKRLYLVRCGKVVTKIDMDAILERGDETKDLPVEAWDVIYSPHLAAAASVDPESFHSLAYHLDPKTFAANFEQRTHWQEKVDAASQKHTGFGSFDASWIIQSAFRGLLTNASGDIQPPGAVFYNDRKGVVFVRARPAQLDIVRRVLDDVNGVPVIGEPLN